jgi:hypothetical protein
MDTFAKFFTGTTGIILAIGLCIFCLLVGIGALCLLSGSVVGNPDLILTNIPPTP